jgi:hypothetical protein
MWNNGQGFGDSRGITRGFEKDDSVFVRGCGYQMYI